MKPIYADTLTTITRYLDANGYAPTVTEIAVALGISHTAARKRVLYLVECGLLTYTPRVHRGIALTGATVYRECKCGRPITDANAVRERDGRGRLFMRRQCDLCVRRDNRRAVRAYKRNNRAKVLTYLRSYNQQMKIERFKERIAA